MIKVTSKVNVEDKRGKILVGDEGETSSVIPQSRGKYPVWFKKHKREFYWFPVWMKIEEIHFNDESKQPQTPDFANAVLGEGAGKL